MKKVFFCLIIFLTTVIKVIGQDNKIEEIIYSSNNVVRTVKFIEGKSLLSSDSSIQLIQKYFKPSKLHEFRLKSTKKDDFGFVHNRYSQYYDKILVEKAEVIVHIKDNQIVLINGEVPIIEDLNIVPNLSPDNALQIALEQFKGKALAWEDANMEKWIKETSKDKKSSFYPSPELVIWSQIGELKSLLAYKISLISTDLLSSKTFYIDAHLGTIIHIHNLNSNANEIGSAVTKYSGTVNLNTESTPNYFRLNDVSRGNGIETKNSQRTNGITEPDAVDFQDYNNVWDEHNNSYQDNAALDAHYAAQKTFDYFKNTFGRNSYDNNNSKLRLFAHYSQIWNNSAWVEAPVNCIVLGDGNNTICSPVTSLDAVAHEFGHAITRSFADMYDEGEPASIKEGLSDIWGACVEIYTNIQGNLPWVVGEDYQLQPNHAIDLQYPNNSHYHIDNNLLNPAQSYTDRYLGNHWYTGESDYHGEHFNSTVLSHWFYLLSVGGVSTNENGEHYAVSGIGISKASIILYNYYQNYITPWTNYDLISYDTKYISTQLYGSNSNEAIQTWNAWFAVGLSPSEVPSLITGDQIVCYPNTTTYSLSPELEGATIAWSTSSNIEIVGGQGTRIVTVRKLSSSSSGSGTITAVYNHGNGNLTSQKTVWAGLPILNYITGPTSGYTGNQYHYLANPLKNPTAGATYTWSLSPLNGNTVYSSGDFADINFRYPYMNYRVSASAQNICGTTSTSNLYVNIQRPGYYSLSPNPASSQLTIEVINDESAELSSSIEDNIIYKVRIFNMFGVLQKESINAGKFFVIPVSNFQNGTYIIQISDGKKSTSQQLIIKH